MRYCCIDLISFKLFDFYLKINNYLFKMFIPLFNNIFEYTLWKFFESKNIEFYNVNDHFPRGLIKVFLTKYYLST